MPTPDRNHPLHGEGRSNVVPLILAVGLVVLIIALFLVITTVGPSR
jgi:hypothetical protein